eukprot:g42810.t1
MLLLWFAGGIIVTLEETQYGHVTQGVGGGVEVVCDWEVLSFVANREQILYKAVSEPLLGLTDVEEATLGATDAIDHTDRCAGESLSDVKGLFGALNRGEGGDVVADVVADVALPVVAGKSAGGGGASGECGVDKPDQSPFTDTLICLIELILTLNNFSFNSSHCLQTKGVARGTCIGPSYACLFVEYVEQSLFHCYAGPIPHLFLCYIDDCIGAALCSHKELEQFINFTNTFHPN